MNIEETIISITANMLGVKDVKLTSAFSKDLGADSIDCIEILMTIENTFEIEIEDYMFDGLELEVFTVADIVNIVEGKLC